MKILNSRVVVTIIIVLLLLFAGQWAYNKYANLKTELAIANQNEKALNDSIRKTTNRLKQVEYSKQVLVAKNKRELAKLNKEMADKVGKLNGKISSLTSTIVRLEGIIDDMDDIPTDTLTLIPEDSTGITTKAFTWRYERSFDADNYRLIAGQTSFTVDSTNSIFTPLKTSITEDVIRFQILQGLRTTDDGKIEMFATSNYPNFAVEELNSVLLDPDSHPVLKKFTKQKHFSLGLYGGFGGTVNLSNSTIIFGPQFGVGGSWRLW